MKFGLRTPFLALDLQNVTYPRQLTVYEYVCSLMTNCIGSYYIIGLLRRNEFGLIILVLCNYRAPYLGLSLQYFVYDLC